MKRLRNSFKRFYGRYSDLIGNYQRSVKDITTDSFSDWFNAVVQLVSSLFFEYSFCHLDCHFLASCDGCHA